MENLEKKIEQLQHRINFEYKVYRWLMYGTIGMIVGLVAYVLANAFGIIAW